MFYVFLDIDNFKKVNDIFGKDLLFSKIEIKNIYGKKETNILLEGKFYGTDVKLLKEKVFILENELNKKFEINAKIELNLIKMIRLR
jgi:hypothetical protein